MDNHPCNADQNPTLQSALAAVKKLRTRLEAIEQAKAEPVAVIGIGCRFPGGADDPESFWQLLREGVDAIREVPRERWDVEAYYDPDPDAPGKMSTRWGGFLNEVDTFDAHFFGVSPREAASMDPQQRLLLEVAWEALERAGQPADRLTGISTGVFIGISGHDYLQCQLRDCAPDQIDAYATSGNALSVAAGRLSYVLGLHGPSLSVDTACSSSLTAIYLACQSLRDGECDLALTGGVSLMLIPDVTIALSKAHMMASDGRCKTFDASADGFVRGEGCGIVVVKRLSDALASGDPVLAVIRGWACNQDGRSSGLTAPNGLAQQAVIRRALASGRVSPAQVSYVETHGTGTALGDPIEVQALGAVLGEGRPADRPVTLGAVKANIGHLEAASGVAGLIKTVLALQHREIPPQLHLKTPNPYIAWDRLPVRVTAERVPWGADPERRIAGVSSFGFSGTNVHLVLEEAPPCPREPAVSNRQPHLITLSARSEKALRELAERYRQHLGRSADPLPDIAFTANAGRTHFAHRLAVMADSAGQLGERLDAFSNEKTAPDVQYGRVKTGSPPKVAFLFTGQGAQYTGMGRELFETCPTFRRVLEQCDTLLRPPAPERSRVGRLTLPLLSALYPQPDQPSPLDDTAYTQPALFALEVALAQLWRSWGITPSAVLGHSVGEYAAACAAGVLSLEDGLKLIAARGRLMQDLPPGGAMAAILADEAQVAEVTRPYASAVSIAAINGPENIVISGARQAVEAVAAEFSARGVRVERLKVSHAFHSPLIEPMLDSLEQTATQVSAAVPQIDLISNLTGERLPPGTRLDGRYWRRHAREAVRFAAGMDTLYALGYRCFVEIGPKPTLLSMAARFRPEGAAVWLPSLRCGRGDWAQLLDSLGKLYTSGAAVDWASFDRDYPHRRVILPTYPFQRKRYWLESTPAQMIPVTAAQQEDKLDRQGRERHSSAEAARPAPATWFHEVQWRQQARDAGSPAHIEASGRWLIYADRSGVGQALAGLLEAHGAMCELVFDPPGPKPGSNGHRRPAGAPGESEPDYAGYDRVVHLWSLDTRAAEETTAESLQDDTARSCRSTLRLVQALAMDRPGLSSGLGRLPRLWVVTRGSQPVTVAGYGSLAVGQSPMWGLGRVIALEHTDLWGGLIDLDPAVSNEENASNLLAEIAHPSGEDLLAFQCGCRHVARLSRLDAALRPESVGQIRPDSTYLITGGLGGLGLKVAGWLVERGARHLVLVGRHEPSAAAARAILQMEQLGAQVCVSQADVAQAGQLARVLTWVEESMPILRGVIHAAGVLDDGMLSQQNWERFARVLAPKVQGAWNLHGLTRQLPLDFFVLFSSAASLLGSPGQGNYAAANAFLDSLAHYRRAQRLPALSINWSAWAEVGMAAALGSQGERLWTARGIEPLSPQQGLQALEHALSLNTAQVAVLPIRWSKFVEGFPADKAPSMLAELAPRENQSGTVNRHQPRVIEQFLARAPQERPEFLGGYLRQQAAQVLRMAEDTVPLDGSLLELGLDSLMVMEIVNACKRDLKLMLYPREFYEHPSLEALAKYLAREVEQAHGAAPVESSETILSSGTLSVSQNAAPGDDEHPAAQNPPVAFLLSSPRSGSTLLRVMLAGHPDLFCPPELHLLQFESMQERSRTLGLSHLGEGLQRAVMELQGMDSKTSQALIDGWVRQDLPIQKVYAQLQEWASPRLIVDKSPTYAGSIEALHRAEAWFANPKYVCLVRHPYAVIESFVRNRMSKIIGKGDADPYRLAEQIWTQTNQNMLDFFGDVEDQRRNIVRYEELVDQPEAAAHRLCAFFGLPFHPALLKPYEGGRMTDGVHTQSLAIGDPNFLSHDRIDPALGAAWKSIHLPRPLTPPARRMAMALGYELAAEESRPAQDTGPRPDASNDARPAGRAAMRENRVDVRGLPLCLCAWGPVDGPPIVFLHGMLDHGAAWEAVAVPLAEQGYHVIAPDQRGHGCSGHMDPTGSYHLLDYVADVDTLLNMNGTVNMAGRGPITLVGHSMGAAIAAIFGGLRPEKVAALILVESLVPAEPDEARAMDQLMAHLNYLTHPPHHSLLPDVAAAAERLRRLTPSLSEARARCMALRITEPCEGGVHWRWDPRLQTRAGVTFDGLTFKASRYFEILRRIQAPVTLVYSETNQTPEASRMMAAVPWATLEVLPGGHNLHLDAPQALAGLIARAAAAAREPQAQVSG